MNKEFPNALKLFEFKKTPEARRLQIVLCKKDKKVEEGSK